jgi:hypothetical protein
MQPYRTRLAVQALALGLAGVITFGLLAALETASAQQHRQTLWALQAEGPAVQQMLIIGRRPPRS